MLRTQTGVFRLILNDWEQYLNVSTVPIIPHKAENSFGKAFALTVTVERVHSGSGSLEQASSVFALANRLCSQNVIRLLVQVHYYW